MNRKERRWEEQGRLRPRRAATGRRRVVYDISMWVMVALLCVLWLVYIVTVRR